MALLGGLGFDKVTSGVNLSKVGTSITVTLAFIIFLAILGIGAYIYINNKRFNRKIRIIKRVGGRPQEVTDLARIVKLGDMGNEILFLKKMKVYRATRGIQVAKDTYQFNVDKEGNWHNTGYGDINEQLMEMNYEIPDADMRAMNVVVRRLNEKQFESQNWMKANLPILVGGMILVIIIIFMWLMASKFFSIYSTADATIEKQGKQIELQNQQIDSTTRLVEAMKNFVDNVKFNQPVYSPPPATPQSEATA